MKNLETGERIEDLQFEGLKIIQNKNLYSFTSDSVILANFLKIKPKEKILFVSDALPISYSNTNEAVFGGQKIFYDGYKATSSEGVLAGSTLFLDDIYKKVADFVEFKDFIGYTSSNIAQSLNLVDYGKIEVGTNFNDLVIWE